MKGKKIIIISIIINILTIGIIYNFIKKDYLNNKKIIVKAMTEGEYEANITSLNTSHEDYANYIEESKKQIASAITDMGVSTSNEETLENMASNIKNIARDASSINYNSTNSSLTSTSVQGAVDELDTEINDLNDSLEMITTKIIDGVSISYNKSFAILNFNYCNVKVSSEGWYTICTLPENLSPSVALLDDIAIDNESSTYNTSHVLSTRIVNREVKVYMCSDNLSAVLMGQIVYPL